MPGRKVGSCNKLAAREKMIMNILKIEDQQLRDLRNFLERVELRGYEVPRFMAVVDVLANPEATPQNSLKKEVETNGVSGNLK